MNCCTNCRGENLLSKVESDELLFRNEGEDTSFLGLQCQFLHVHRTHDAGIVKCRSDDFQVSFFGHMLEALTVEVGFLIAKVDQDEDSGVALLDPGEAEDVARDVEGGLAEENGVVVSEGRQLPE